MGARECGTVGSVSCSPCVCPLSIAFPLPVVTLAGYHLPEFHTFIATSNEDERKDHSQNHLERMERGLCLKPPASSLIDPTGPTGPSELIYRQIPGKVLSHSGPHPGTAGICTSWEKGNPKGSRERGRVVGGTHSGLWGFLGTSVGQGPTLFPPHTKPWLRQGWVESRGQQAFPGLLQGSPAPVIAPLAQGHSNRCRVRPDSQSQRPEFSQEFRK